jgi:membrane protease subunit (stomatin/prohibitin family)
MGLLQAGIGALSGVLADQWREYFYCDSMPENVLMTKGVKRTGSRNANTKGEDNIITNGSIIAVNEGQCMMIVEQGAIVEFSAQAGEFVWDNSTEPSIFYGNLSDNLKSTWEILKKRFTFGANPAKDQRIYYFNTKEIIGNKYGTANPVPFRVVYNNIGAGLELEVSVKCFGEYSYKITNPMLFYKNVCSNVTDSYTRDRIDSQMRSEMMTALQPAFARISDMGIKYSSLPGHTTELAQCLNEELSAKWRDLRGIEMVSLGISSIKASDEDEQRIKELQQSAALRDPTMAAAYLASSQGAAMQNAAKNEGAGAFAAFAGINMAQGMGGNVGNLFQMGQQQQQYQQPAQQPVQQAAPAANGWKCECGAVNTGKFCMECGKPQPKAEGWTCTNCGAVNKGKFCMECGAKKPDSAPLYKCDKCGWEPNDPKNPPKFCPQCGDPFNDNDVKK